MKYSIVIAVLLLSGCAGAVPWNPQNKAGMTIAEIKWCESSVPGERYLCGVKLTDGKERSDVILNVVLPDGSRVKYKATGVHAFRAHEIRAAVEKAVSADVIAVAPNIVGGIVDSIMGIR